MNNVGKVGGSRGSKLTTQDRWKEQWQHKGPCMAGGRVSDSTMDHGGQEEGDRRMHKGPWRAEGKGHGLDSDNRGQGEGAVAGR